MKIPLQTFPVSAGLLDPRHVQAIGRAVWVYLWFLNRVTRDEQRGDDDFVGIVLNGRPLSIDEIAEELGFDYYACRRHLARLVKSGYVERRKTGAGMFSYSVKKSKKWAWKRQTSGARNRPSSSCEKQANLFPPTEAPTERKMLSGSEDPQSKICAQGADPQSRKCNSTEQNMRCAESGSRARSQETTKTLTHTIAESERPALEDWVTKIATEHPGLAYLKGRSLSQIQEHAIADAIVRDGPNLVLEGTRKLRDAASRLPKEERRFIPNPVRFYQQSEYLPDSPVWDRLSTKPSGSPGYVPLPADYIPPSEVMRRARAGLGR
jgi:hypothetical protein